MDKSDVVIPNAVLSNMRTILTKMRELESLETQMQEQGLQNPSRTEGRIKAKLKAAVPKRPPANQKPQAALAKESTAGAQ